MDVTYSHTRPFATGAIAGDDGASPSNSTSSAAGAGGPPKAKWHRRSGWLGPEDEDRLLSLTKVHGRDWDRIAAAMPRELGYSPGTYQRYWLVYLE